VLTVVVVLASSVDSDEFMSFVHPSIWVATEVSRPLQLCGSVSNWLFWLERAFM